MHLFLKKGLSKWNKPFTNKKTTYINTLKRIRGSYQSKSIDFLWCSSVKDFFGRTVQPKLWNKGKIPFFEIQRKCVRQHIGST